MDGLTGTGYADPERRLEAARAFDALVASGASPSALFDFLDASGGFSAVFEESLLVRRLFESDFFFRCQSAELGRLFSLLESVPEGVPYPAFLTWQLAGSRSSKAAALAYDCRAVLSRARKSCPVANPHSWPAGRLVRHADRRLSELCREDAFLSMPEKLGRAKAALVLKNIGYSLFQGRMLQPDFFASLDGHLKDVMLDGVERTMGPVFAVKFAKAVISGPFSLEYKKRVVGIMRNRHCGQDDFGICRPKHAPVFGGCSSFQEFMLGAVCAGRDVSMGLRSSSFALFLLCARPSWLREWAEIDAAEVAKWLDCADVLAALGDTEGTEE